MMSLKARKSIYCQTVCRAWCCKNMVLFYDSNEKDIDSFFKLRNIQYDPLTKQMIAPLKCNWLTTHNKCKLYSWRPYSCRMYECEKIKSMTIDS